MTASGASPPFAKGPVGDGGGPADDGAGDEGGLGAGHRGGLGAGHRGGLGAGHRGGVAANGDVHIAFERPGPGEPLLLVAGLGCQSIWWPAGFLAALERHGFAPARFDNRDCGRSTHLDDAPTPGALRCLLSPTSAAAYGLEEMADDAAAVLDTLGWRSAHVLGVSLGGAIAQVLACRHPARVTSLTSVMSTPALGVARPRPAALFALARTVPTARERAIRHGVAVARRIASPAYPPDPTELEDLATRQFERAHDPAGMRRQQAALATGGDRREALGRLEIASLVIHGEADPVFPPEAGRATAAAIRGAQLFSVAGMGHDLPSALFEPIAARVAALARRATAAPVGPFEGASWPTGAPGG